MATGTNTLADQLYKILVRHSPEAVEAALEEIRARETVRFDRVRQLILSLEPSAVRTETARSPAPRKKKTPKELLDSKILAIRRSRNPNRAMIADFVEDISNKQVLPATTQLGAFGQALGVPISSKKIDRSVMAKRIADALERANQSDIRSLIDQGRAMNTNHSSLQSWANVIVKHR